MLLALSLSSLHVTYTVLDSDFNRNIELYIDPLGWLGSPYEAATSEEPTVVMNDYLWVPHVSYKQILYRIITRRQKQNRKQIFFSWSYSGSYVIMIIVQTGQAATVQLIFQTQSHNQKQCD
jgi:hypothetical protein